jgi:hypothetical protein
MGKWENGHNFFKKILSWLTQIKGRLYNYLYRPFYVGNEKI